MHFLLYVRTVGCKFVGYLHRFTALFAFRRELTKVDQRKTGATNKPTGILCYTTVLEHVTVTTIAINITTIAITNINKITINTSTLIF